MRLYTLIGIAWDQQEGSWYPVSAISSPEPFKPGGLIAFRRSYELLHRQGFEIVNIIWDYDIAGYVDPDAVYDNIPLLHIDSYWEYATSHIRKYIDVDLANDLHERGITDGRTAGEGTADSADRSKA